MTKSLTSLCILVGLSFALASADVDEIKQTYFSGKEADAEIYQFMSERWGRQVWQMEYKQIGGGNEDYRWHVKGSHWWVALDGPRSLKENIELDKLDTSKVYQFTGIPVDQNYGVVTFYVTSHPEIVPVPDESATAPDGQTGETE